MLTMLLDILEIHGMEKKSFSINLNLICKEIERQSSQGELDIPKEEDELKVKEDSESQEKEEESI